MGSAVPNLRVDPVFSMLVMSKPEETRKVMEERLLQLGNDLPIRVWDDIVLVEQDRYLFCKIHGIPFTVKKLRFHNAQEAIAWVCSNQLRREDLVDPMRKYLIGCRARAERQCAVMENTQRCVEAQDNGLDAEGLISIDELMEKLGKELQLASITVRRCEYYAQVIDRIMGLAPILAQEILSGKAKITFSQLVKARKMYDKELLGFIAYCLGEADKRPTLSKYQASIENKKGKAPDIKPTLGAIKEMPAYDPDAEVASLALTIPSWVESMQRTERTAVFSKISDRGRKQLIGELTNLLSIAERMLGGLYKEDRNE